MLLKRIPLVGLIALAMACQSGPTQPPEELVAKVNGEGITKKDFEAAVERNMARYRGKGHKLPPGIEQRIKESVLRRLIDDKVVAIKATEMKVIITDENLTTKFAEHKARFRTEQAFQDYLRRSNNTEENMKKDLRRNMLRDQVVEKLSGSIDVIDQEVKDYYDANVKRFIQKEQVKTSRVLIRVSPKASDADKKAAKTKANAVRKMLTKADADFKAIAKEHSQAPEAARGGDLGWLSRGRMPPEFDEVAFGLGAGKVSKVFESRLGYEIIQVGEKKEERQRPFEEVQANIKNSLQARKRNQKRREVLKELKGGAQVEQLLKFDRPPQGAPQVPPRKLTAPGKDLDVRSKLPKAPVAPAATKPAPAADKKAN